MAFIPSYFGLGIYGEALFFSYLCLMKTNKQGGAAGQAGKLLRVLIVGAGRGGSALLDIMRDLPDIQVVAVVDKAAQAPAIAKAASGQIPVFVGPTAIGDALRQMADSVDVLIDVTGDPHLHELLLQYKPEKTRLISGPAARFIWELIRAMQECDALKAERDELIAELEAEKNLPKGSPPDEIIFGRNPAMQQVRQLIEQVAPTPTTVLLTGETGTGKEVMARMIHEKSQRKNKRFVKINCTAFSAALLESELFGHVKGAFTGAVSAKRGLLEEGNGGTIFLDEIGDISLDMQVKLLRFLQFGELRPVGSNETKVVDVRVIAATNRPLKKLIKKGRFRKDLYYRLNAFAIELPPLRERAEDIEQLAQHFLKKAQHRLNKKGVESISTEAMHYLSMYDYPGNLREMQSIIERAVILCQGPEIKPEHLPANLLPAETSDAFLPSGKFKERKKAVIAQFERNFVANCLRKSKGNVTKAAELAGIPRKSFYRLMEKHRLSKDDFT